MRTYLLRGDTVMYFGPGVVLESLEAEPLRFPSYPCTDSLTGAVPERRRFTLTGYLVAREEAVAAARERELSLRRRLLSFITCPVGEFTLGVGQVRAVCTGGELSFTRKAPFSGTDCERFTLTGEIKGGYFCGERVVLSPTSTDTGFAFPLRSTLTEHTVGQVGDGSYISLKNRGDTDCGFYLALSPTEEVYGFSLTDSVTGRSISCPDRYFYPGDEIRLSTLREDLFFYLYRDGQVVELQGFADEASELFSLCPGEHILYIGGDVRYTGSLEFTEAFVTF